MVKFLDYFFLKLFRFVSYLKKDSTGAKWGAFLYLSAYVAITVISIVCLVGLWFDNYLSQLMRNYSLYFWMTTFVLIPILLSFRYYRQKSIDAIEASYNSMKNDRRRLVDLLIYATMITIPIFTLIIFRLYVVVAIK